MSEDGEVNEGGYIGEADERFVESRDESGLERRIANSGIPSLPDKPDIGAEPNAVEKYRESDAAWFRSLEEAEREAALNPPAPETPKKVEKSAEEIAAEEAENAWEQSLREAEEEDAANNKMKGGPPDSPSLTADAKKTIGKVPDANEPVWRSWLDAMVGKRDEDKDGSK